MQESKNVLDKFIDQLNLNINPQNGEGAENNSDRNICPCKIMDEGFSKTPHCGSSTCCIAVLNGNKLDVSNLGDSGFMSFEYKYEKGTYKVFLKEKSKPQQHSFNYPLQLVRLPNQETYQKLNESGNELLCKELRKLVETDAIITSTSEHSDKYSIQMNKKKIVVFGTDGLFDNLFVYEIISIIQEYLKKISDGKECFVPSESVARGLSKMITKRAYFKTKDPASKTPFQKEYYKAKGRKYIGGKVDDITTVVVL